VPEITQKTIHPTGEQKNASIMAPKRAVELETYGGKVHVEWDPQAAVTPLGQLPFFIDFLKTAELFDPWVSDCPLDYKSPNAPKKVEVLGTLVLSVLAGHFRYAHINTVRCDGVNPELLGMNKVASEDSVRRAFLHMNEDAAIKWLQDHLMRCYGPLLYEPWILDIDSSVKPLYGHQEGAVVGYNPQKFGRPSHVFHTYMMANTRLVLDVETRQGNQTAALYTRPGLWALLRHMPREAWPKFLRGDCAWGNEGAMSEAEENDMPYLFKLKQSQKVKDFIATLFWADEWIPVGQGWEGIEGNVQLDGWTKSRRAIAMRRRIRSDVVAQKKEKKLLGQKEFVFMDPQDRKYEYAVLVTSLDDEIEVLVQHYRDRADAENNFDELKNQWGWCGYTTHDIKRCGIISRIIALVYNWWTLFTRLAIPSKHAEAITSRPLLMHAIGRQTKHAGQTTITITSMHAKAGKVQRCLTSLERFLREIKTSAEQLTWLERWRKILSRIFVWFLKGRPLAVPKLQLNSV